MQFIDLQAQYRLLEEKINARIQAVLNHGQYIMGPEVGELEERLSDFVGVKHTIACANGTDALQLALMALDIGPGDAVFTTPFTFFATAEVISLVGARPVFVDVDERTFNIDPQKLEEAIIQVKSEGLYQAKAVIAVDLFGLPADYERIEPICRAHGLKLIEDSAQGLGGRIGNRLAGSFGDIATTSFFPAKPLGCYGDGGALFTNNDELAVKLQSLRIHGKGKDKYDNIRVGMNSRLDTLQAAILLEKLEVFPNEIKKRQGVASRYNSLNNVIDTQFVPKGYQSVWAQYTVRLRNREDVVGLLNSTGIPTAIYYPTPMHFLGAFKYLDYKSGDLPVSEELAGQVLSLPISPYLTNASVDLVVETISSALNNYEKICTKELASS